MKPIDYFKEFLELLQDIPETSSDDRDIPISRYTVLRSYGPDFQVISFNTGNKVIIPKILASFGRDFWIRYGPRLKSSEDDCVTVFSKIGNKLYSNNSSGILEQITELAKHGGTEEIRDLLGSRFPEINLIDPITLVGPYSEKYI